MKFKDGDFQVISLFFGVVNDIFSTYAEKSTTGVKFLRIERKTNLLLTSHRYALKKGCIFKQAKKSPRILIT